MAKSSAPSGVPTPICRIEVVLSRRDCPGILYRGRRPSPRNDTMVPIRHVPDCTTDKRRPASAGMLQYKCLAARFLPTTRSRVIALHTSNRGRRVNNNIKISIQHCHGSATMIECALWRKGCNSVCVFWHCCALMKCQDETISTMVGGHVSLHQTLRKQNSIYSHSFNHSLWVDSYSNTFTTQLTPLQTQNIIGTASDESIPILGSTHPMCLPLSGLVGKLFRCLLNFSERLQMRHRHIFEHLNTCSHHCQHRLIGFGCSREHRDNLAWVSGTLPRKTLLGFF